MTADQFERFAKLAVETAGNKPVGGLSRLSAIEIVEIHKIAQQ